MKKITFENNITKASAETFTEMQNNIEEAINEVSDTTTDLRNNTVEISYLGQNPNINELRYKNGIYGLYGCIQAPITNLGVLEVLVYTGDWVVQRYTEVSTGSMWQRVFTSGTTWNAWVKKW